MSEHATIAVERAMLKRVLEALETCTGYGFDKWFDTDKVIKAEDDVVRALRAELIAENEQDAES